MRQKTIRLIESIHNKGIYGNCSCRGEVLYYNDMGVRCSTCGKLYGIWTNKYQSLIQRTNKLINQTQNYDSKDEESDEPITFKKIEVKSGKK